MSYKGRTIRCYERSHWKYDDFGLLNCRIICLNGISLSMEHPTLIMKAGSIMDESSYLQSGQ